jgi:hypothetical protein
VTTVSSDHVTPTRPAGRRLAIALSPYSNYEEFIMPKKGMALPRQLSYEKWLGIGAQLAAVTTTSSWCLGDWLTYGENAYSGRYRDAIEQTSLDYQTLRNYAWVAKRFPLSRRRDGLSFAHHAEVAGLPEHEQDFWLRKAEDLSWSRNKLRQEVRSSLSGREATGAREQGSEEDPRDDGGTETGAEFSPLRQQAAGQLGPAGSPALIEVKLSAQQLESCQAAAGRRGRSIEEWAASTLDLAARQELGCEK